MGFDGDSSDSEDEVNVGLRRRLLDNEPITTEELLDGLPLWLDRLFEGSTQRYYIGYWPDFPVQTINFRTRQYHSEHHSEHHSQHHNHQSHHSSHHSSHHYRHMHED